MSDDLFREVDEEVRQDQYLELGKKYGAYAIGVALVVVLITVGFVFWRDSQQAARDASGEQLLAAINIAEDQADQALDQFAILGEEGTKGYRLLARFREGALLSQTGDVRGAVAVYDKVAEDSSHDQIYRDLAKVLAVSHGMSIMNLGEVEERLASVLDDDNSWRYSARELVATAVMASGDSAAAREAFQALVDDVEAPAGVRARGAEMLAILAQ
ncbi:MAG: tetratricopeptide repeat protein [Alphaproteobacteria bacterium]|nr:tetratricopeptide repeat protein [Alphaproteobacteria bacterium]